jgi:hypothetical protein
MFMTAAPAFAETAVVRGLDKITGHARDYSLPIGRPARIGSLEVIARACQKSAPEDTPEVTIFVDVYDHPPAAENAEAARVDVFHGWLFASSPGLSAIEHPYYDLWAVDCR